MIINDNRQVGSYLVYKVNGELFASDSNQVRGIFDFNRINSLKRKDKLDNIRFQNENVDVIDLAALLDFKFYEYSENSCLIVLELNNQLSKVGIVVDDVVKLVDIEDIDKVTILNKYNSDYIRKSLKYNDAVISVLDIIRLCKEQYSDYTFKHLQTNRKTVNI